MSVLFVSYSGVRGGGERLLLDALAGAGARAVLACPDGPLAQDARAAGIPVLLLAERDLHARRIPLRAIARLVAHAREIRSVTRALGPAAVVGWSDRSALALALAGPRRTERIHMHNDLPTGDGVAGVLRLAARRADRVVTSSNTLARAIGLDATVIHPGVDLDAFAPPAERPPGPPTLLTLGAIVPWKGTEVAVEAAARLPGVRLVVAGEPLGDEGRALARRLAARAAEPDLAGRVEFTGGLADPRAALHGAHALLHPAERESFGIAVAEAMACGLPVAAADAGALAEVTSPETAVLFSPGDADAAAAATRQALARPELGAAGRERAVRHFGAARTRAAWGRLLPAELPAPDGTGIALVTVAHDSAPELERLLASVARLLPAAHVVVADAGSSDDSAEVARAAGATVVDPGGNVGFGRANNLALEAVTEPVTILLNPDTELVDASLAELALAAAERDDRILAPLLLRPDGRREASAHPAPLSPGALALALAPPGALPHRLRVLVEPAQARRPRRVGWAVGAALAAPTSTLRALGPFDPELFLYAEDLDLGLRAARAGVETWIWPQARVIHHAGHAAARAFGGEPVDRLVTTRHAVVARHRGERAARLDTAVVALTHATRYGIKRVLGRDAGRERAYVKAASA